MKSQTKQKSKSKTKQAARSSTTRRKPQKSRSAQAKNSRRQYSLAVLLFCLIVSVFFGGDLKGFLAVGTDAVAAYLDGKLPGQSQDAGKSGDLKDSTLQIHFLDIGQGDATYITCDGHSMLVDAGNNNKGTQVQSYLESQKISSLDYLVGTHPDADHIGGLDVVLTKFPAKKLFMPDYEKDTKTYEDVVKAAKYRRLEITHPKAGQTYPLGSAKITILGPLEAYSDANDNSVCFLLEHGENRFLFTGDAEEDAESDMLSAGENVQADVYKVSHHGSKTATTEAFFREISPVYAVISCGDDNRYGHPHAEVLNRLRAAGVQMFRTDDQGTVVVVSDGTDLTFNCSPSDDWAAGE